jgi:hypothetical protein
MGHRRGHRWGQSDLRIGGGHRPLTLAAAVAAVIAGGAIAAGVVSLITLLLTAIGTAIAGAGGLLLYGWIIAGFLIYRAIRSRIADDEYTYYEKDWDDDEDERSRRGIARPDTRPQPKQQRSHAGTAVTAILAGLVLAAVAGLGLSRLSLPPSVSSLLPPLAGGAVGIGVYAALRRWIMPAHETERPTSREIKGQVRRIKRKSVAVRKEAARVGGVFDDVRWQAPQLATEASELCRRVLELRRASREVRREMGSFVVPEDLPPGTHMPGAPEELQSAREAQKRLDSLMARNRENQQLCLTQMERIEDLLDVARLEITCPPQTQQAAPPAAPIVQEFETELKAARAALDEVLSQEA